MPHPARRARGLVGLAALGTCAATLTTIGPAAAAPVATGRLVNAFGGGPVSDLRVELFVDGTACGLGRDRRVDRSGSAADGTFTLDASRGGSCEEYYLRVRGNRDWQGGYLDGAGQLVARPEHRANFSPTALGNIPVVPAALSGTVKDAATGTPVRAAHVIVTEPTGDVVDEIGRARTRTDGSFVVRGIVGDEVGIFVDGPSGYLDGWVGCSGTVVPTWPDACSHAPGPRGTITLPALP